MSALTPDAIRSFVQADLDRRIKELPAELNEWNSPIAANANGWGIHFTQITALRDLIAGLSARQQKQLDGLKACAELDKFSDSYYALLTDLGGAHDLWRIFRIIFEQRQNVRLKPLADAADLIAWDCYRTGLLQGLRWGKLSEDQFRPPPLTLLESAPSPATASRGDPVGTLGFSVRQYRDMMLPLPIVLYPIDQAGSIWSMTTIAHEVGHNLDHDLAGKPGKRVSDECRMLLIGKVDDNRLLDWRRWMPEIFADGVAVVLCGVGFVLSMALLTISLALGSAFRDRDPQAVHPPLFLRLRLLGHMLSLIGTAWAAEGAKIVALCDAQNRPAWLAPYETETKKLATMLMTDQLEGLGKHTVLELNSDPVTDADRISRLAEFFVDPTTQRPDPPSIPYRAVCAAAAQAMFRLPNAQATQLDALQVNAQTYLKQIPRPKKLAANLANRDYLDSLTARLSFQAQQGTEKENSR